MSSPVKTRGGWSKEKEVNSTDGIIGGGEVSDLAIKKKEHSKQRKVPPRD